MAQFELGEIVSNPSCGALRVRSSLVSAASLQEEITCAYAIGSPVVCCLLRRGLHDTYLITASGERYIVRVYRAGSRSPADVAYEVDFLEHLASRGISVSRSIPDRKGRLISLVAAPEGTRPFVVFSYARGVPLAWTEAQSHWAGCLLAEIHTAADDFVSPYTRSDLDLDYLVDRPMAALRRFLMHRPDDWAYLDTLAKRLRTGVAGLSEDLRWGVCHGDFGAKNIHIDEAHKLTVFDFDRCGPGWRAFDFALVMWAAAGRKKSEIWDSFLRGYRETRILEPAELAAVPLFHALAQLSSVGLVARHADTFGRLRIDDVNLDGWLTFFRRWEAEQATSTLLPAS